MSILRMTAAEVAEHQARLRRQEPAAVDLGPPRVKPKAKPKPRTPNRLETRYGQLLELALRAGDIEWYAYEDVTLRIAHDCRLAVDYAVVRGGRLELHECKGPHAWEDSLVKLRVAARQFPWIDFYLVRDLAGAWDVQAVRR